MLPLKTIEDLIKKHTSLEKELSSGEVDKKLFAEKSKEYSELNDIIKNAKKFISYAKDKLDLEKIIEDPKSDEDFKEMAIKEIEELKNEHYKNEKKLLGSINLDIKKYLEETSNKSNYFIKKNSTLKKIILEMIYN